MNSIRRTRCRVGVLAGAIVVLAACSSSSSDGNGGTGGNGGSGAGGSAGNGGSGSTAGTGGGCATSCDDGFNCTVDSCKAGKCEHSIGPNNGATACPAGQFCTADKGCVASPACATVADCTKVWSSDACKSNIKCDAASSVCTFDVLDKDHDGYPPPVCGGGDCNDDDPAIRPGAKEVCNGKDDDCDGVVDNEPIADKQCQSSLGVGHACQNGTCACKPDNLCGSSCVDKQTSLTNCGACGVVCSNGEACNDGICSCLAGKSDCGGSCVDTGNDPLNCGACGHACDILEDCNAGQCACPPQNLCNGQCIDYFSNNENCGACGNKCVPSPGCTAAWCSANSCLQQCP